jgi:hypothetical protein
MSVPRRFVGAWERERLDIDGARVSGIGRAVWIQSGAAYVDVRAPGTAASGTSFGGRGSWRAPVFTWHHDFDLHPREGSVDRGELTVLGDRIIERGVGLDGGTATYAEEWRRRPTTQAEVAIARHDTGLAVLVGDHAAWVFAPADDAGSARAWEYTNDKWIATITIGSFRGLPEPGDSGWQLTAGWCTD